MKRFLGLLALAWGITLFGCSASAKTSAANAPASKSMEQIYQEEGYPVRVQALAPVDFSVYLKYPTVLRNQSESIATAKIEDFVRKIEVKVGDYVKRDQVLLSFSSDNTAYQQAKIAFDNAQAMFNRSEQLFSQSGISKQDFDNVRTQYEIASRSLKAAEDMIFIKAPIDGTVSQIYVKETQSVKPGEPLVSISNKAGFEARFYVTSDEIDMIKVGSRAKIEDRGASIEGRVVEVPLVMDPAKGAFAVRALFSATSHSFVSGMSVDVAVEVYENKNALVVPLNVIGRSEKGAYVYVASGNHAQKRDVVLGRERGLDVEIVYGLKAGDQLIVDGIQGISDNVLLKISR